MLPWVIVKCFGVPAQLGDNVVCVELFHNVYPVPGCGAAQTNGVLIPINGLCRVPLVPVLCEKLIKRFTQILKRVMKRRREL